MQRQATLLKKIGMPPTYRLHFMSKVFITSVAPCESAHLLPDQFSFWTYRDGIPPVTNPVQVARDAASATRKFLYDTALRAKANRRKAARLQQERLARSERLKLEQEDFMLTHSGLPKVQLRLNCWLTQRQVFTQQEILRLNDTRAEDDQISLTEGGLPRHHCAFPQCPKYLINLSTKEDRILLTRRGVALKFTWLHRDSTQAFLIT